MSEQADDPQLADYRASIDNIDAALVHLLAERFKITKAVGRYKASADLPPADPAREEVQIARLRTLGRGVRARSGVHREVPPVRGRRSDPSPSANRRGRVALTDARAGVSPSSVRRRPASRRWRWRLPVVGRGVHLVSVDSMQVYRRMDIGTAKPSAAEQAEVPHHCLDLVDPDHDFTVAQFKAAHATALGEIAPDRRRRPAGRRHRSLPPCRRRRFRPARGSGRSSAPSSKPIDDTAALYERLVMLDPRGAQPRSSRRTVDGSSGPSRSPSAAGGRSVRSVPASTPIRDSGGGPDRPPPTRGRCWPSASPHVSTG